MRIFFFSETISVLLCFILWGFFQVSASFIAQKIPAKFFDCQNILFRAKKFEDNGKIYKNILKINIWKRFLPDGAAVIKSGYRKKHLVDYSKENLNKFLEESCRAEFGHLLAITPFWIFGFFLPVNAIFIMFIYAVLINLPCVLAQRYNRPRILGISNNVKLQKHLLKKATEIVNISSHLKQNYSEKVKL